MDGNGDSGGGGGGGGGERDGDGDAMDGEGLAAAATAAATAAAKRESDGDRRCGVPYEEQLLERGRSESDNWGGFRARNANYSYEKGGPARFR